MHDQTQKLSVPSEIKTDDEATRRLLDAIHERDRMIQFAGAVELVREALGESKAAGSYYYSWQANIAMAFMDALPSDLRDNYYDDMHEVANTAAKRFLDTLIG